MSWAYLPPGSLDTSTSDKIPRVIRLPAAGQPTTAYLVVYLYSTGTWAPTIVSEPEPTLTGRPPVALATAVVREVRGRSYAEAKEALLDIVRREYPAIYAML